MPLPTVMKAALDGLVSDPKFYPIYTPRGDLIRTFCNLASKKIAKLAECGEFDAINLLADDMLAIMEKNLSRAWVRANGAEASSWAISGGLAFAAASGARLGAQHGHITPIYPREMEMSGSLGRPVPWCANVGKGDPTAPFSLNKDGTKSKPNWVCRISNAYPVKMGEPAYFLWNPPDLGG